MAEPQRQRSTAAISAVKLFGMDRSDEDRWGTFARVLSKRRESLDLTQREVYAAGGPSPTTQVRWESGEVPSSQPRPRILMKLDAALRWPAGTAKKVLDGELAAEEAIHLPQGPDRVTDPGSLEAALDPSRLVTELAARILRYIMATRSMPTIAPELAEEGDALTEQVSEHYATLLLERHGGPDQQIPDEIANLLFPTLTSPEPARGTPEHHRWAYRRWLAGVSFPDEHASDFQAYWDSRTYGRKT